LAQRQAEAARMEQLDQAITEMVRYLDHKQPWEGGPRSSAKGGVAGSLQSAARVPMRFDVRFSKTDEARRCVEEVPSETASHCFKAFLGYNNRPWHRRGWGIAEAALALEIPSRAHSFYPLVASWLTSLPVPKAYAVDKDGEPTVISLEKPKQRRLIIKEIHSGLFTFKQDTQRVSHMYSACTKRIVTAFEQAEATRESALLEAAKGSNEMATIARRELADHRKRLKELFGDSAPSASSPKNRRGSTRRSSGAVGLERQRRSAKKLQADD